MSLKEWKNKELFGLLSQKWGFGKNLVTEAKGEKGDADPLDGERKKFDKDLDGIPDGADPNPDDPDNPDAKKKSDKKDKKEKDGDDENEDKDLSKVPPQLRKHVAKKK
jgi:hypothetical protein